MKRLLTLATVLWGTHLGADPTAYPIYEIPLGSYPNLCDGTLEDWRALVPGPSLTQDDFAPPPEAYGAGAGPAAFRVYLAWTSLTPALWIGVERTGDLSTAAYPAADPSGTWVEDRIELMVDGDHSGGNYAGFSVAEYGEEMSKLLTGYQAQQYGMLPEAGEGRWISSSAAASGWMDRYPWADVRGSRGAAAFTIEGYVTPWDALDWHGPELSTRSTLSSGRIIGFQISVPDWGVAGTFHAFRSVSGLASTWRTADAFVDGELIGCDGPDCGWGTRCCIDFFDQPLPWVEPCNTSAVEAVSWGRVKAALR